MADELKRRHQATRLLPATREVELLQDGKPTGYCVDLDRCRSPNALLGWIVHLCEKTWVTPRHVRELIEHVEDRDPGTVDRTV